MKIQDRMKCFYTTPNMKPLNNPEYNLIKEKYFSNSNEIFSFIQLVKQLKFLSVKPAKLGYFAKAYFGATSHNKKFYISFSPNESIGGSGNVSSVRTINSFIQEFINIVIHKPVIRVPKDKKEGLSLCGIMNDKLRLTNTHMYNISGNLNNIVYNHLYSDLKKKLIPVMGEFNSFISTNNLTDRIKGKDYEKAIKFLKESAAFAFSSNVTKEEMIEIINLAMVNEVHHE